VPAARHLIIDPYQTTDWSGKGITTLRRIGVENFQLLEQPSEVALPNLLATGQRFEFAFIDGCHTFDHTLLDFFYLNRMLKVKGVVVFDDVCMPAVRRCVRYIANYPAYRVAGQVNRDQLGWKWRALRRFRCLVAYMAKPLGDRISNEVFDQRVLVSDRRMGIDATMVALEKVSEDERGYNWYHSF